MKYYIIEMREPTNNPGDWVTKMVFQNKKEAEKVIDELIQDEEEVEELNDNEWDDQGPNWKRLRTIAIDETVVTLDEVDNDRA